MSMGQPGSQSDAHQAPSREDLQRRIEERIRRLERASALGFWAMVLFLLVSLAAFDGFSILPDLSDDLRAKLGAPPPSGMISLALVVYAFSGIVRTLASMSRNIKTYQGLMHAAFFSAFYMFYQLSGTMQDNFWAVFFAGISVMGLENFYLWSHSSLAVSKERELLDSMKLKEGEPEYRD